MNSSVFKRGWKSDVIGYQLTWMHLIILCSIILTITTRAQILSNSKISEGKVPKTTTKSVTSIHGRPAIISIKELADYKSISAERRRLIQIAINVATEFPWLPYLYGGADPAIGGLDCSGAMYYVMRRAGLNPPRSAASQYYWLEKHKRVHLVPEEAESIEHASMRWLKPGDLIFWSKSNPAFPRDVVSINHVAMYLGRETSDARRIMINSTDGRSYRGVPANGYGIYDFRIPRKESKSKLIGYGTPPGIPEMIMDSGVLP